MKSTRWEYGRPPNDLPFLPLTLSHSGKVVETTALVDSGAMVNVLPYDLGLQLGADWDSAHKQIKLTGNMSAYEARGIVLDACLGDFPKTRLVFAWTRASNVPVILGQINFFLEFDIAFSRSQFFFEISPKE